MKLVLSIALRQLMDRKRQSFVSLFGIILGVAFFLAVAGLMQGSEKDFVKRLVDNSPHITILDEYRNPKTQPAELFYKGALVEINNLKPSTENRGIRGFEQILFYLRNNFKKTYASAVLVGQGVINFAGKDSAITINGMVPNEIDSVSTIGEYMTEGSVKDLIASPDGIIIGAELAKKLSIPRGNNITVVAPNGQLKSFKVVGIFRTGRSNYDNAHTYIHLKRAQALLGRIHRANNIIVKIGDPYTAREIADQVEKNIGYKSMSWQETSEDLINTLAIRNKIMYSVVSAVLIVAAFGIYNVISTVVMEKHRDIAILKSMGFYAKDIQRIFVSQGIILGVCGCCLGIPLGMLFMTLLMRVRFKPPGSSQMINMPIDWGAPQFIIAITFALTASIFASYLPSRKAAKVQPVDILRGGAF